MEKKEQNELNCLEMEEGKPEQPENSSEKDKEQDEINCLEMEEDKPVRPENSGEKDEIMANTSETALNENSENVNMNECQIQKIENKNAVKIRKSALKLKKKQPIKRGNSMDESLKKLAKFDLECKIELHKLQVEVEKKRLRNIDREYDLIEAKIKYYKTKSLLNMIL